MQHFGDLQPLGQQDIFSTKERRGNYSASRSRWHFAVGKVEIGFHREHEEISASAEPTRPQITADQLPTPRIADRGFGERFMTVLGIATALIIVTGATGMIWSMQSGATIGRGEISTAIRDVTPDMPAATATGNDNAPYTIPAKRRPRTVMAVIENAKPGPVTPPAEKVSLPITETGTLATAALVPSAATIRAGNFTAIPQVASAVSAALASGDAQNWSAGPYHGLVVIGTPDAAKCREGTVLFRDGTPQGRTQSFRRCPD